jgi:hypothetical protein
LVAATLLRPRLLTPATAASALLLVMVTLVILVVLVAALVAALASRLVTAHFMRLSATLVGLRHSASRVATTEVLIRRKLHHVGESSVLWGPLLPLAERLLG